jgi:hypothetical protein
MYERNYEHESDGEGCMNEKSDHWKTSFNMLEAVENGRTWVDARAQKMNHLYRLPG